MFAPKKIPKFHMSYFLASTSVSNSERSNGVRDFGFNIQLV